MFYKNNSLEENSFLQKCNLENTLKLLDYNVLNNNIQKTMKKRLFNKLSPHLHFGEISPNIIWHNI